MSFAVFLKLNSDIILYCLMVKIEMNRKREGELQKLQREVEELQMQNETQLGAFRKKHQEVQSEFADQVDQINKLRQK